MRSLVFAAGLLAATPATASVISASEHGFEVQNSVNLVIPQEQAFVSNAVKHFKFELRGKRRIHKSPTQREITACRHWPGTSDSTRIRARTSSPRFESCVDVVTRDAGHRASRSALAR